MIEIASPPCQLIFHEKCSSQASFSSLLHFGPSTFRDKSQPDKTLDHVQKQCTPGGTLKGIQQQIFRTTKERPSLLPLRILTAIVISNYVELWKNGWGDREWRNNNLTHGRLSIVYYVPSCLWGFVFGMTYCGHSTIHFVGHAGRQLQLRLHNGHPRHPHHRCRRNRDIRALSPACPFVFRQHQGRSVLSSTFTSTSFSSPITCIPRVEWGWQFKPEQPYYYYRSIDITDGDLVCKIVVSLLRTWQQFPVTIKLILSPSYLPLSTLYTLGLLSLNPCAYTHSCSGACIQNPLLLHDEPFCS